MIEETINTRIGLEHVRYIVRGQFALLSSFSFMCVPGRQYHRSKCLRGYGSRWNGPPLVTAVCYRELLYCCCTAALALLHYCIAALWYC